MNSLIKMSVGGLGALVFLALGAINAQAHCDALDGPVVTAARKALAAGDVNLVLVWVQKQGEAELRQSFVKTLAVRKLNSDAKELADMYFFDTLVRIHRAGEGAPYTGLQPPGKDVGPAILSADKAVADGKLEPVAKLLGDSLHQGLTKRFGELEARKHYATTDVQAGREYVKAYVEFVHYVESIHAAAAGTESEHAGEGSKPAGHEHH